MEGGSTACPPPFECDKLLRWSFAGPLAPNILKTWTELCPTNSAMGINEHDCHYYFTDAQWEEFVLTATSPITTVLQHDRP
jgi:hypothetical protein